MILDKNKLPDVDDGTVRADIVKFIIDNEFTIDLSTQMHIDELQALTPDLPFVKIADCLLNTPDNFPPSKNAREYLIEDKNYTGKLVDYKVVDSMKKVWKQKKKEWIYVFLYDKRIVKIGRTSSSMDSRFTSYNSGKSRAMSKGTPATTNYMISQCNYLALLKGMSVEVYAQEVPSITTTHTIYGTVTQVENRIAHEYERMLINIYKKRYGARPFLCGQ